MMVAQFSARPKEGFFLYAITSRLALKPTHSPLQWAPGVLLSGIDLQGHEADHSLPSSTKVKNM
jgi:hypothetical protein